MSAQHGEHGRLMRLLIYRSIAAFLILLLVVYFYYAASLAIQRHVILSVVLAFFVFAGIQGYLLRTSTPFRLQLLIQFALDVLLISALIIATGGIHSPFVFLFGLLVVVAGTQAHALVVIMISVLAAASYLVAIHTFAWWWGESLTTSTLHILLQVSALFLVGGVMAAIAQRHASLQQESTRVVRQHRRLQELHDQVMGSMQEGVLVLDRQLYLQDTNTAARHLLGIEQSAAGQKLTDILEVPEQLVHFLTSFSEGMVQCEWTGLTRNCLVTATHLPEGDPNAYWLLTLVDISELRQLERKLADQNKLAAMGRMAAMLAHEVRNPMQSIGQAVELLGHVDQQRSPRIRRIIAEEVGRLNRLVSDMLDYVQPLQPTRQMVRPCEIINTSVEQIDLEGSCGISQMCALDQVWLDPDHFRLVVDNLLRNALKASPGEGTVSVELQVVHGQWVMKVCDQGGGIDEKVRGQLFEPFTTAQSGGTGLGLATVWQVCQANGWQVAVESSESGSCFTVSGPLMVEVEAELQESDHG